MIIVWGTRWYGKVDRVPGLCYVVTRFGHLWYVPLVPLETYLILDLPGERGNRGKRIPMSPKSVFLAWLRGGCAVAAIICGFVILANAAEHHRNMDRILTSLVVFAACAALFGVSYLVTRASASRAAELGAHLGIPEEALADLTMPKEERLRDLESYLKSNPDALDRSRRRPRPDDDDEEDEGPPERSIRRGRGD
jgi:hypothetical protein